MPPKRRPSPEPTASSPESSSQAINEASSKNKKMKPNPDSQTSRSVFCEEKETSQSSGPSTLDSTATATTTNTVPSQSEPASFRLFPNFPPELRLQIVKAALPAPRILNQHWRPTYAECWPAVWPALNSASVELRQTFLKNYQLWGRIDDATISIPHNDSDAEREALPNSKTKLWIDWARDLFFHTGGLSPHPPSPCPDPCLCTLTNTGPHIPTSFHPNIRNIVLSVEDIDFCIHELKLEDLSNGYAQGERVRGPGDVFERLKERYPRLRNMWEVMLDEWEVPAGELKEGELYLAWPPGSPV